MDERASGLIASIGSRTGGKTSYSTSMRSTARLAISSLSAATAATASPKCRTTSLAKMSLSTT